VNRALGRSVFPAVLLLSGEQAEHASRFLGIPLWIWQILNLVSFLAVLIYFVAKPMAAAFRKRQQEIEQRRQEAEKQRASVEKLSSELRERTRKIELEIAEIRKQGRADGEEARAALAARAGQEGERLRKDAAEEIERHLSAARAELHQAAADLTAASAQEILSREITTDDRQRLLTESVARMKETR
jgi:F0F1-type ATP synthase membrane subunit b/b'